MRKVEKWLAGPCETCKSLQTPSAYNLVNRHCLFNKYRMYTDSPEEHCFTQSIYRMHSVIQGYLYNADTSALGREDKSSNEDSHMHLKSHYRANIHFNMQLSSHLVCFFQLSLSFTFDNFQSPVLSIGVKN